MDSSECWFSRRCDTDQSNHGRKQCLNPQYLRLVFFGAFCLLATVGTARRVLMGTPVKVPVTWQTVLICVAFILLALQVKERVSRALCALLGVTFGSRILLAMAHASLDTRILNAQIMRVVETAILATVCLETVYWLMKRLKRI